MTNSTNTTQSLADIIRSYRGASMTRNQLKVARARLRAAGVTNLGTGRGRYTVNPTSDLQTDRRAEIGTVVAQVAAMAVAA